jgi:2,3,4,5-tetrahydropyridine-2-carboxylate N-succinyltransferase
MSRPSSDRDFPEGPLSLKDTIENLFADNQKQAPPEEAFEVFDQFRAELNAGRVRAAEKLDDTWMVNTWVKKGILLGFRIGAVQDMSINDRFIFYDKSTLPLKSISSRDGIRVVPGGSSIRDGCYVGRSVTCMPPMFINIGAYVDDETMIDSHVLVGSCAQLGKRVHISAAAQIGGVLEPIGSLPVIIEDDVLVGGNCGIYEGTIVRGGAVVGAGTILTGSTPVYDIVRNQVYRKSGPNPLEIPARAVVVPGSRAVRGGYASEMRLSLYTPIIVKYRDEKTAGSVELEDILR